MPGFLTIANAYFGTAPALVGLSLLIRPDYMIPLIFENPPTPTANRELVEILLKGFAIRDIYMGMMMWACIFHGSRKVKGWCLIAGASVAAVDGYALNQALGRGLWTHLSFIPVVMFLGVKQAFF
jgi:hypothetical protein